MNWHERFVQQAGWTRELRKYLFARAGLEQAGRVLEVGCGTGAVLVDLETTAEVHGIDLDASRLREARQHAARVNLACADALRLPYAAGTFEITFCHFLLMWVSDPLQALREMKRVTRPGGAVLALAEPDYTSRVDEPSSLKPLGRLQTEALRLQGPDPSLGKRLGELFREAGMAVVETGAMKAGERQSPAPADRELEWKVLESDLGGTVPAAEMQRFKKLDENAWEDGTRRMYVPTYFAHGVV